MKSNELGAAAFVILILSGVPVSAKVLESDGSQGSVRVLLRAASDGDTITLPAGTFSWTSRLDITKGITLQGATTITGTGTSSPTITDATIIKDDTPRSGSAARILKVDITPAQSFRMTGFTFTHGASTQNATSDGAFHLVGHGASPVKTIRIDHCHFNLLYQNHLIWPGGWNYGVADHNVFHLGDSVPFNNHQDQYGGTSQINGNGAWADYPWYGTEKFFFIEDNTIIRTGAIRGMIDGLYGARFVIRHNYVKNAVVANHGTEGQAARGARAHEIYDNTFEFDVAGQGGSRSGTTLIHDNTFLGTENSTGNCYSFSNFRESPARPHPIWGIADGTSVWDKNDTEGNGTFVEGHPPYLFDSGTDDSSVNSMGVIHDSTKSWTTNQWIGYSIKNKNPASTSYNMGSYVISSTTNTITYSFYSGSDGLPHLIFNSGDA
jgi:hypothetical protein